jgi:acetyl esterase/lipase
MQRLAALLSPVNLLNGLASIAPIRLTTESAYAEGPRHGIDIYRPRGPGRYPLVVFFYGGGWEEGDRAMYRFVGAALAAAGFCVTIPDYRVFPEVRFPAFVEDGARAVRWSVDQAAGFGGDASRTVLMGHSAGAHIAAMLALDPQWLAAAGVDRHRIAGLVGLAGPYDFTPNTPAHRSIFGQPSERPRTQPISFAGPDSPPAFFATGREDRVVDPDNSERLAARLRASDVAAEVALYANPSHESLIGAFSPALRFIAPVFRDSIHFIRRVTAVAAQQENRAA